MLIRRRNCPCFPSSSPVWALALLLATTLAIIVPQLSRGAKAAPQAVEQPENVACRPHGGAPDQVRVEWKDTNADGADYNIYRKNVNDNVWGNPIATVTDADAKGRWRFVDASASTTTVYHYQVTADDSNDETTPGADHTCREPLRLEGDGPN
jgi:hypothetical protein